MFSENKFEDMVLSPRMCVFFNELAMGSAHLNAAARC